ncbi:hypothetical protein PF005_g30511 [Phytophthora fragariae]|uniref:Secreted protein n=1 Tax=Phytophthora fragariae TaxID=53985 RepID=A0A6A3VDA5_9STRA|nr:hypothetical protein PF003_g11299 [Phytophthora fragariae]KAE8918812.1 hypothetical protein PF009_g30876 [Phytophthora fragariae]KAE9058384.1 hypothetical protein PF007_g31321 [Phytophthora fragariae]KAE9163281.1 hypothetical protein PF005_g30511 [Phytophthora fragariae]KAE9164316.1 hypothetical protein PF004_g29864 [Phytophthora fragariae]
MPCTRPKAFWILACGMDTVMATESHSKPNAISRVDQSVNFFSFIARCPSTAVIAKRMALSHAWRRSPMSCSTNT